MSDMPSLDSIHIEKDTTRHDSWHVWRDGVLFCTCTTEASATKVTRALDEIKALYRIVIRYQSLENRQQQTIDRLTHMLDEYGGHHA